MAKNVEVHVQFPLNDYWRIIQDKVHKIAGKICEESGAGPFGEGKAFRDLHFHMRDRRSAVALCKRIEKAKLPNVTVSLRADRSPTRKLAKRNRYTK